MTNGAIGTYQLFPQLLDDLDMLREVEVGSSQVLTKPTIAINNRQKHRLIRTF